MKNRFMMTVLSSLLVGSMSLFAAPYTVDVAHSSVGFKVKHMMVSTVSGNFSGFSGSYDLEKGVLKSLRGTVKTSTIDTGIVKRDDHLRSADFFDAIKFPELTFVMTSHKGDKVMGNLTIHGVTKAIVMQIDMGGEIIDPWKDKRSGFVLSGKVNRKDFGLNWNQAIESGGFIVGDEVKVTIEIEGVAD